MSILLLKYFFWERYHRICSIIFFRSWDFFLMIILLIVVIVQILIPILHFTVFPGCYHSPSVKLDSTIFATKGYIIELPLRERKKKLSIGTPLGKANWQSGNEIKALIFYAFISDICVTIVTLANFASRKKVNSEDRTAKERKAVRAFEKNPCGM